MPGFGSVAELALAGLYGDSELTSVVFIDYPLYGIQASDRAVLVPGYDAGGESLYPDSLGYSLGDISLGIAPSVRIPAIYTVSVSEVLTFTQTAAGGHLYNRIPADTLTFTQSTFCGRSKVRTVTDTLVFTELSGHSQGKIASDTITFVETLVVKHIHNKYVTDNLIFNQNLNRSIVYNRRLSDTLTFGETFSKKKIITRSVNDTLFFVNVARKVHDRAVSDLLHFIETFASSRLHHVYITDRLNFNENASPTRIIVRNIFDFLKFQQAKIIIPTGAIEVEIPFAQYTIIRNCDTFILETDYVILESPESTVILPTPLFDDTDIPTLKVDIKRTMGNQVYSFIKRNLMHTIHYEFAVGRKKSLELQQFLNNNAGKFVWLKNWKGEVWYGNILTNPTVTTLRSRYDNEREKATVTLEFAGVKM